jgi:hypothetical protein
MDTLGDISQSSRSADQQPGYYAHTNSWPAETSGTTMSLEDIYAAVDSMDAHYQAAVRSLEKSAP